MTVKKILLGIILVLAVKATEQLPASEPSSGSGFAYAEVPGFGNFRGLTTSYGGAIFRGIPFGEPPIGENRWKKPVPLKTVPESCGSDYYDATSPSPGCPQFCNIVSPEYFCAKETDEDCLFTDVFVPSKLVNKTVNKEGGFSLIDNIQEAQTPVMVFIYGGAFLDGTNDVIAYDGRFIAKKGDVIVVVPNYRVGPFGFFYQNDGTDDPALGNFGIWDQIEALRWVKDKIGFFGGDPTQVTLFGESAGAQSVAIHLVNDYSNPLFKAAILESNPWGVNYKTTNEAQDICNKFVESFGACTPNDMECLRGLTTDELMEAMANFPLTQTFNKESITQSFEAWSPTIDNDLLTEHPFFTFRDGNNQNKPILHGTNKDEGMMFVGLASANPIRSNMIYKAFLRILFGKENLDRILEQYPADCPLIRIFSDCDNRNPMSDVITDYLFTCPDRRIFKNPSRNQNTALDVWGYTFNQVWSFPENWDFLTACYDLVCHSAELPYVFGIDDLTNYTFSAEEAILSDKMIYYWSNFAKFGNPNPSATSGRQTRCADFSPDVSFWPKMYEDSTNENVQYKTMSLAGAREEVVDNFKMKQCDLWDDLDLYLEDDIKIGSDISFKLRMILKLLKHI